MPQGLQALLALFVLLPRFISARAARAVSSSSEQTELERIIEALILSFLLYTIYIVLCGTALPIEWVSTPGRDKVPHYGVEVHPWRVVALAAGSVLLGLCWGFPRSTDKVLRLFRWLRLTQRTAGSSVWNKVFYSLGGTVQIGLGDGRVVHGWLSKYSDTGGERSGFSGERGMDCRGWQCDRRARSRDFADGQG